VRRTALRTNSGQVTRRCVATPRRAALTLLEVIIAVALMSMLMAAMLVFFWQTMEVRRQAAAASERAQIARQVLARIEAELRGTIGFDEVGFPLEQVLGPDEEVISGGGPVPRLIGDRRSITFLTTALPDESQYDFYSETDEPPPARHDLTQVSYWLWVDPENTDENGQPLVGGIIRTEKKTLNQAIVEEDKPLDVRNDLWSHELGYLEFRYFDGVEWDVKWDITQGNSLPQMIQVTVGFEPITQEELEDRDLDEFPISEYPFGDDHEHPDRYTVIVRLPAADRFFSSRFQRVGQQIAEQFGLEGLP